MRRLARALVLLCVAAAAPACASAPRPVKVALTPLTVVRDVVDAPLTSVANLFEDWADASDPTPKPSVGVGVGRGGVGPYAGLNLGYYVFKPLSWLFGGIDYLVGRSLWPNVPRGVSPWRAEGERWGSLYFPSTKALWPGDAEGAAR